MRSLTIEILLVKVSYRLDESCLVLHAVNFQSITAEFEESYRLHGPQQPLVLKTQRLISASILRSRGVPFVESHTVLLSRRLRWLQR